jgi:hypothetical protein
MRGLRAYDKRAVSEQLRHPSRCDSGSQNSILPYMTSHEQA